MLADVLAEHGLTQLHIAETEKYAHVTFFFNGGVEKEVEGEERVLVPSPRDVPTYDHKPEMSAVGVTDELVAPHRGGRFDFVVVNYANADMVGHTGVIPAAVKAVETVDACLGRVVEAVAAPRRRLPHHRRPRQLRPHARAGRQPQHGAQHQPGAVRGHGRRRARARGRPALRPRADGAGLLGVEQPAEMTGADLLEPAP